MTDRSQIERLPRSGAAQTLVLAACLLSIPAAADVGGGDRVTDKVFGGVQAAREAAGSPALVRRPDLDAVAHARARRIAALPHEHRFAVAEPIENDMDAANIESFRRVVEHVDLWSGYTDPGDAFLSSWRRYEPSWETAISEPIDSIGMGVHRASDGWFVFVAVLVEDRIPPSKSVDVPEMERATLKAVNRARKQHGLRPLRTNAALADVARAHSDDMIERDYFAHRSPSGAGSAVRVQAAGIPFVQLGENIHKSLNAADPVAFAVRSWLRSPEHREILLDPVYRETGVGVGVDDDGTIYFTQLFLVPRDVRN